MDSWFFVNCSSSWLLPEVDDKVDEQYKRYTGEISRESRAKVEDKLDEPEEKRALILNCQRMTTNIRSRAIIHRRAHLLLKQRILLRYEN